MPVKMERGLTVDIQRTNGIIHSASITEIDWQSQSVTVEWTEQGDVKGKEVEFRDILALNKHIDPTSAAASNLSSVDSKNNNHGFGSGAQQQQQQTRPTPKMPPPQIPAHRSTRLTAAATRASALSLNTTQHIPNGSNGLLNGQANESRKGSLRSRPHNPRQTMAGGGGSVGVDTVPPLPQQLSNNNNTAANRRKSNVLKEVDKIKKQREERRAKQEAQKQEKIDLMNNVEPGSQNWDFLKMIREYQDQLTYKPIGAHDEVVDHQICVAVRKRPLNKKEIQRRDVDVVTVPGKDLTVVHEPKQKVDLTRYLENHFFRFDYAFEESATNELVYRYTAKPLVQTIFNGGMATCFAYGQTGSGKTHTMGGDFNGKTQDSSKGIYALVARDVFKLLKSPKFRNENLLVYASFFEIYSGKVFDLLNDKAKLRILEDAHQQVQIVGLREESVESVEDVLNLINTGNNIRTSGQTSANNHSSRSHAVFQIILKHNRRQKTIKGKFSLIDLAGNERGADTSSANRQTRMEGAEINKSLLALKECIRALGRKGAHLPFRASKLTQVLRDSFIKENSRTCMIAMISPGMQSCEHSLNTLRYANRVKELGTEGPEFKSENDNGADDNDAEDDLALLHNSNSLEISQDMHTFHEAISHLQDMEDEISETHKNLVETDIPSWLVECKDLLKTTAIVDYDVDQYAQQLENQLSDLTNTVTIFKEKVVNFRTQLKEEELMSKRMLK